MPFRCHWRGDVRWLPGSVNGNVRPRKCMEAAHSSIPLSLLQVQVHYAAMQQYRLAPAAGALDSMDMDFT